MLTLALISEITVKGDIMKVLGILCSPHKKGNSAIMLAKALAAASERGAEVETVWLNEKNIHGCNDCRACLKTEKCRIKDDMTELYEQVMEANAIIFATPVYYCGLPGPAKSFLDRLHPLAMHNKLSGKIGASLIVASSIGHESTWSQLNFFFSFTHMVCADHVFGFAWNSGDVRKDRYAMLSSKELGRQVVALAEQHYRFPEEWPGPIHTYVLSRYGADSCPAMNTRWTEQMVGGEETKGFLQQHKLGMNKTRVKPSLTKNRKP